jgi:hypothetical protein
MRNSDVKDLFERVAVGDVVELHGARDAEIAQIFGGTETGVSVMAGGGQ